ncbi:hypothetical protein OA92_21280 [Marinomonas sp. SBI22]|uniref:hypothetical protein n=1 Tax=unclassified Marinomonas TaxID=196814 RepID=UPI0007AFCCED|nr:MULTISPECIES: hypothetical protein [unclassified Marinomonas]KZM39129.1 hypothetical protein OA92_21280 [Marinomonas sp. SBI22]KZM39913.1 hypothetical protein OA91_21135 [Marinomonas sp. SBI8L]
MPNDISAQFKKLNDELMQSSLDAHKLTTEASKQQQAIQADSQATKSLATAVADQAKKTNDVANEFKF